MWIYFPQNDSISPKAFNAAVKWFKNGDVTFSKPISKEIL